MSFILFKTESIDNSKSQQSKKAINMKLYHHLKTIACGNISLGRCTEENFLILHLIALTDNWSVEMVPLESMKC